MDFSQLSPQEIEGLRAMLAKHDEGTSKVNEFDLNNPPQVPYVYREFPRVIYHHDARKTKVVQNAKELEAHLAQGWEKEPFPAEVEEPELDAASAKEAAGIDQRLIKKPKK